MYMDKSWRIIDDLVAFENMLESYYKGLIDSGFKRNEANEIMNYFVVNKIKQVMEEK